MTTRMFGEQVHCLFAVLEKAMLQGYRKPQLERVKALLKEQ